MAAKVTIRNTSGADTPTEAAVKAASELVYVTDKKGRKLGLRKIPFLEEFRILETVGPELSANQVYMGMLNFLLLIGEIDGVACEIPRTKRAVEALIQWAGKEAFSAIASGIENNEDVQKFFGGDKELKEQIKNAEGTPA